MQQFLNFEQSFRLTDFVKFLSHKYFNAAAPSATAPILVKFIQLKRQYIIYTLLLPLTIAPKFHGFGG